jgi:hypothetical protein
MSESVAAAPKTKKIAKTTAGRQVRLWVRAKFLSFRRYFRPYSDPDKTKTPTRLSSGSKASTIALLLNTTSENASPISTKPTPERLRTDLEYFFDYSDYLGPHHHQPRKHWCCFGEVRNQPTRKSHRFYS